MQEIFSYIHYDILLYESGFSVFVKFFLILWSKRLQLSEYLNDRRDQGQGKLSTEVILKMLVVSKYFLCHSQFWHKV